MKSAAPSSDTKPDEPDVLDPTTELLRARAQQVVDLTVEIWERDRLNQALLHRLAELQEQLADKRKRLDDETARSRASGEREQAVRGLVARLAERQANRIRRRRHWWTWLVRRKIGSVGGVELMAGGIIEGWIDNGWRPDEAVAVRLRVHDTVIDTATANLLPELVHGAGRGHRRFRLRVDPEVCERATDIATMTVETEAERRIPLAIFEIRGDRAMLDILLS